MMANETKSYDFLGSSVVKNLPSNTRDMGWIPGWETKIPPAQGQLSLQAKTTELCACTTTREKPCAHNN